MQNSSVYFTLDDILGPLKLTGLKIKLMTADELQKLTLVDLQSFSPGEIKALNKRLLAYFADCKDYTFIRELNALSKEALRQTLLKIPLAHVFFLENDKIKELAPSNFTIELFEFVRSQWSLHVNYHPFHSMTKSQIDGCINLDIISSEHMEFFSNEQLKNLDFHDKKMNERYFHLLAAAISKLAVDDVKSAQEITKGFSKETIIQYLTIQTDLILLTCSAQQL